MDEETSQFIEAFGLHYERIGLSQTAGRIAGYLMICEPPHQTLDDISTALQMAKSTINTTIRSMTAFTITERVSLPGDRKHYYRISRDLWEGRLKRSMDQFKGFRMMAEQGLALMQEASPESRQRLQEMYDLHDFLEREFPALLERWHAERDSDAAD